MERSKSLSAALAVSLLAAFAVVVTACRSESEVARDADVEKAPSAARLATEETDNASAQRIHPDCPNDLECLLVRDNASIAGWTSTGGLQVGGRGLFTAPPLALCDAIPCENAMWWQFNSGLDRLILRSAHRDSTNPIPVLVIERRMSEDDTARVGIGVPADHDIAHALEVNGTIRASEIIIESGWADHVFADDYELMPLEDVARLIDLYGHLPGVPPGHLIATDGVRIGDMQVLLLQKIEEMTLHLISQQREITRLRERLNHVEGAHREVAVNTQLVTR